jgi:hypothetical protein
MDRLETLILPKRSNACNKLHKFEEAVEVHRLSGQWFSAHARVDGAVVMVTMPEIRRYVTMYLF